MQLTNQSILKYKNDILVYVTSFQIAASVFISFFTSSESFSSVNRLMHLSTNNIWGGLLPEKKSFERKSTVLTFQNYKAILLYINMIVAEITTTLIKWSIDTLSNSVASKYLYITVVELHFFNIINLTFVFCHPFIFQQLER